MVKKDIKPSNDKYFRILFDSKVEEFKKIRERIDNGELQYSHFAVDNDKYYQYYLILK